MSFDAPGGWTISALASCATDLPGHLGSSIVDRLSGVMLAMRSSDQAFDITTTSTYMGELLRKQQQILEALESDLTLESIVVNLDGHIQVVRPLDDKTFLFVAADPKQITALELQAKIEEHFNLPDGETPDA